MTKNDARRAAPVLLLDAAAVCIAGAGHGLSGSPWLSFVMASGALATSLSTDKAETRATARSVVDSLAAVAIYRAVRASCAPAKSTRALPPPPLAMARPWARREERAVTVTPAALADRALTAEHQEALDRFQRGEANPSSLRRAARRVLVDVVRKAAGTVDTDPLDELRARLSSARESLRLARLVEESTSFQTWNRASLSTREHILHCGADPSQCPNWTEDNRRLFEAEALVDAAEVRAGGAR